MERYTLREAQDHLQELIQEAQAGKTIVILDEQDQAVQLVPLPVVGKPRQPGSARGQIKIAPDFDAPIPVK
ncbi:MAG: type II toxin-antitoxin system prevent-host-death family antitoxin [Anaerolineae bacterium]|nr:type II toxin-antitoxin system prevent-host-death family antitoxin [Anaerolineae bacterium]